MPRRVKEEAEKTRARILASALDLFATRGYEHTTFTDIAGRLKMTKGAVYWYFESKEALLLTLLNEMHAKFARHIEEAMPAGELTFAGVANMMVANAKRLIEDPKATAFFILMHEQIRWSSDSMNAVRMQIMKNETFGPWRAFQVAVENDQRAGRVRADVKSDRVAHACLALWDGLVHAHIGKFMDSPTDLFETLRASFAGVWRSICAD